MTVAEFYREHPELKPAEPTFSEWAREQLDGAIAYRHEPRQARFRFILDLIEEGRPEIARWLVPPSDEKMAAHLTR